MLGSVQAGGDALVRLNDAFTPDPVFVDVPAGATVAGPLLVVHWCDAGRGRLPAPRRAGRRRGDGVGRRGVRRSGGAGTLADRAGDRAVGGRGRVALLRVAADPGRGGLVDRPPGRPGRGGLVAAHLHGRPGRRLRPGAGRRVGGRPRRPQRDPVGLSRRRLPGARHPDPAGPRGPADDERAPVPGCGGGPVALGLQRADPGAPRRGAQRRPPDQPQPRARTRVRTPTRCPTSTSSRTTSSAPTPRRSVRSTRTSATTSSRVAWRPRWPRASSCGASSTPSSTAAPFPR